MGCLGRNLLLQFCVALSGHHVSEDPAHQVADRPEARSACHGFVDAQVSLSLPMRGARTTGSAILWSLLCGAATGALVGFGAAFVLPTLTFTERLSLIELPAVSLQGFLILSWYLIPLGLLHGLFIGALAGLTYPLTRGLRGRIAPAAVYAVVGGAIAFAVVLAELAIPAAFLERGLDSPGWSSAALIGLASALIGFAVAQVTVHRQVDGRAG